MPLREIKLLNRSARIPPIAKKTPSACRVVNVNPEREGEMGRSDLVVTRLIALISSTYSSRGLIRLSDHQMRPIAMARIKPP